MKIDIPTKNSVVAMIKEECMPRFNHCYTELNWLRNEIRELKEDLKVLRVKNEKRK